MDAPVIVFLTDYGLADDFVGICHAVIARRCPEARVIDLTHGIPPHDVRTGALVLARALPFLPAAVLLAVVDPGVGGPRRAVAVRARDGRLLVGPDNGLLWPAILTAGGVKAAVDLAGSPLALSPVSATFHGRDLFAPVAAGLAEGTVLEHVGAPIDPATLITLTPSQARREGDALLTRVASVDRFGNLQLDARPEELAALGLEPGSALALTADGGAPAHVRYGRTFADVAEQELLLYADGHGMLALAVGRGSAAARLGGPGAEFRITAAGSPPR